MKTTELSQVIKNSKIAWRFAPRWLREAATDARLAPTDYAILTSADGTQTIAFAWNTRRAERLTRLNND